MWHCALLRPWELSYIWSWILINHYPFHPPWHQLFSSLLKGRVSNKVYYFHNTSYTIFFKICSCFTSFTNYMLHCNTEKKTHTSVFRCLSPFKIGTDISLEQSVRADLSWKFEKRMEPIFFFYKITQKFFLE